MKVLIILLISFTPMFCQSADKVKYNNTSNIEMIDSSSFSNLKELFNFFANKNPELQKYGYNNFAKDMENEENLKTIHENLSTEYVEFRNYSFESFKSKLQGTNRKLYNRLIQSGRVTPKEIGDFDTFNKMLQDPQNRVKLYNNLRKNDLFTEEEIGNQEEFYNLIEKLQTDTEPTNYDSVNKKTTKGYPDWLQQYYSKQEKKDETKNETGTELPKFNSVDEEIAYLEKMYLQEAELDNQSIEIPTENIIVLIIFGFLILLIALPMVKLGSKKDSEKKEEVIDFEKELIKNNPFSNVEKPVQPKQIKCSNCGIVNPSSAKFCSNCGSPSFSYFDSGEISIFNSDSSIRYASFKERLLAKMIDFFIIFVLLSVIFSIIYIDFPKYNNPWLLIAIGGIITFLYQSLWLSSSFQATPGRIFLELQVKRTKNKNIKFDFATLRYLAEYISGATFYLGYFMMLFNKKRMTLHDYLVGAIVVKKDAKPKNKKYFFHFRNIFFLAIGGLFFGFLLVFSMGGMNSDLEKLGVYFFGVLTVFGVLAFVLLLNLATYIFTKLWIKNPYKIAWPIFLLLILIYSLGSF